MPKSYTGVEIDSANAKLVLQKDIRRLTDLLATEEHAELADSERAAKERDGADREKAMDARLAAKQQQEAEIDGRIAEKIVRERTADERMRLAEEREQAVERRIMQGEARLAELNAGIDAAREDLRRMLDKPAARRPS